LTTDPLALARLLMGGQPQTAGTAFEPVTWQQQLQNYKGLEGQENAWRTAEGSPWKPAEPAPMAKMIGNALTSEGGQRFMDLANFIGPGPKMAMRGMVAARQEPKGIRAYHASPHDFDRFDISKIGTGEGAQAYGHGLYAAESPMVSGRGGQYDQAFTARALGKTDLNQQEHAILRAMKPDATDGDVLDAIMKQGAVSKAPDGLPEFDQADAAIRRIRDAKSKIYEVNIKADPSEFLDWDVPLSKQSEKAQQALLPHLRKDWEASGNSPSSWLEFGEGQSVSNPVGTLMERAGHRVGPEQVSQALREAGIPGIRYKDQGSRGAEGGTSNYVVFDDKLIDIVKKYGLAALLMGGATGGGSNSGNAAP
jgi:hypothetical protein